MTHLYSDHLYCWESADFHRCTFFLLCTRAFKDLHETSVQGLLRKRIFSYAYVCAPYAHVHARIFMNFFVVTEMGPLNLISWKSVQGLLRNIDFLMCTCFLLMCMKVHGVAEKTQFKVRRCKVTIDPCYPRLLVIFIPSLATVQKCTVQKLAKLNNF